MLALSRTFRIVSVYVELKKNTNCPLSPGASSGDSRMLISLFTLTTAPKSSAVDAGARRIARRRRERARAGARILSAEVGRPSYTYRGVNRGKDGNPPFPS